jgi:hypothetical protein
MPLTNAQKQARWRERNIVVLTARAEEIAEKLMDMADQKKLRKVARLIGNHLKNPNRSQDERNIDLGRLQIAGKNGKPLGKRKVLAMLPELRATQAQEDRDWEAVEKAYMAGVVTEEEFGAYGRSPLGSEMPQALKAKVQSFR